VGVVEEGGGELPSLVACAALKTPPTGPGKRPPRPPSRTLTSTRPHNQKKPTKKTRPSAHPLVEGLDKVLADVQADVGADEVVQAEGAHRHAKRRRDDLVHLLGGGLGVGY
jgi:hypothetical protein